MTEEDTTEPDNTRQLSMEQRNAIELLAVGLPDYEVAKAVGVARQTVNGWYNHNPSFRQALITHQESLWGSPRKRLAQLAHRAIDVIHDGLYSGDPSIRQKAAFHILRVLGLDRASRIRSGHVPWQG